MCPLRGHLLKTRAWPKSPAVLEKGAELCGRGPRPRLDALRSRIRPRKARAKGGQVAGFGKKLVAKLGRSRKRTGCRKASKKTSRGSGKAQKKGSRAPVGRKGLAQVPRGQARCLDLLLVPDSEDEMVVSLVDAVRL